MIEITGLRKAYAGRNVLDSVDLVARPGQLLALLGPNGAGKTTTVEIVEGYRAPDAGTVRVLGEDPRAAPRPRTRPTHARPACSTTRSRPSRPESTAGDVQPLEAKPAFPRLASDVHGGHVRQGS